MIELLFSLLTKCHCIFLQLKAVQLEWNHNWKVLNEKKASMELVNDPVSTTHPSRHQRILKKHILSLEKTSKQLRHETDHLKTKLLKMEEEMLLIQKYIQDKELQHDPESNDVYDRINGNKIEDYVKMQKIREIQTTYSDAGSDFAETLLNLTHIQTENKEKITNLTKQMANFDKLHLSMLELLENVESIENKVDNSLPEFRKEISKLEVQLTESNSEISMLKEDQTNTRNSLKAIGVSVSNMQDKTDSDRIHLQQIDETVKNLVKASNVQHSKLHDHILKVSFIYIYV